LKGRAGNELQGPFDTGDDRRDAKSRVHQFGELDRRSDIKPDEPEKDLHTL